MVKLGNLMLKWANLFWDAQHTNFNQCSLSSNCMCCQMPADVCRSPAHKDYTSCNGRKECDLNIFSNSTKHCPAREYDCQNRSCHSRWVQVFYSCKPRDDVLHDGAMETLSVKTFIILAIGKLKHFPYNFKGP